MLQDNRFGVQVDLVRSAIHEMRKNHPDVIASAKALSENLVSHKAAAKDIWPVLWEKPLYSYVKQNTAGVWIKQLAPLLNQPEVWHQLASSDFEISRIGKTISNDSYAVGGRRFGELKQLSNVSYDRLYRIIGIAKAFSQRAETPSPYADLPELPVDVTLRNEALRRAVALLKSQFGYGWSHVTVLHFMTDLGLAVKPDIQLMRSLIALGYPARDEYAVSLDQACSAVEFVFKLVEPVMGEMNSKNLRFLDKVLMEASVRKVWKEIGAV